MLMIRLQRVGRKNDPSFRVVLTDRQNSTKSGKFIEVLGTYDARKGKGKPAFNAERIQYWMTQGAKLTDTMSNLLISKKVIEGKKVHVLPKRKIDPNAAQAEAEKAAAAPEVKEEAPAPVEEAKAEEVAPEAPVAEEATPAEDSEPAA